MRNSRNIAVTLLTAFLLALMLGTVGTSVQADGVSRNTSGGGEDKESNEEKKQEDQKEEGEPANKNDNCGTKGGPVSLFDGKERAQRTDLVVNGLFPIRISRQYDSQSKYDSQLGYGWSLNHDRRLYQYPDGSVVIRYGCGSRDRFVYTGGAYVTPSQGRQGMLTENPDGSFVYRRRYGTTEYYDPEGRITALQNKYGHRHEYTYDPAGKFPLTGTSPYAIDPSTPMTVAYQYRLTRIDERAADGVLTGNFVTLAYSGTTGRLTTVTASDGRTVGYVHDTTGGLTRGNLEQVNGLESIVATYRYEDPNDFHNLTYIRNAQNATPWVNSYDSLDRVSQQTYGNDTLVFDYVVDYTETTVIRTVTDPAGLNPYDIVTTYEFDANGDVALMRDYEGNESVFVRDVRGDLVSRKYYENRGSLSVPDLVLLRDVEFSYDALGRMLTRSVTLDDGETVTRSWAWDNDWLASEQVVSSADPAKIFRTEYDFYRDGLGVPTNISVVRRRMSNGSFQSISFNHDGKNRVSETILPDGQKMVNVYEGGSLYVTRQYFEIGAAESPNERTRHTYDSQGNQDSIRDARDNLLQLAYDDLGRVTSVANALGEESHYTYDGHWLVQTEIGRTVAEGEGQVFRYSYTPQGWLSLVEEKDSGGSWHTMSSYTYDSAGQKLSSVDALSRAETYTYDGFGQMLTATDPLSNTTTYSYDLFGNMVSIVDAEGRQTLMRYDDLDREIETESLGVTPAAISKYTHDADGNVTSLTDAEGKVTVLGYDTLSRLELVQLPLGQTEQYFYDDRDRVDYHVNGRGQKVDYSYEPWGPVSSIAWYPSISAPTPTRTVTFGLDPQGNISSITDDSVQAGPLYTYTYDALNRPDVTTATYIPGGNRVLDEGFDRYGNRNSLDFVDGSTYSHTWNYNERGRLVSSVLPGGQTYSFGYFDTGELQQVGHPNSATTAYAYRNNGPVETITVTGSSGTLGQYTYAYDAALNVDTMTDADGLHDFGYDGLDRLTQATYPPSAGLGNESYVFDKVGNREDSGNPALYAYDDNHRITQSPSYTYGFDDDGNLVSRSDGASLGYNEGNRLQTFSLAGTTASYVYDSLGRRIKKTVNGVTTWFLWDQTKLIATFDGAGNRLTRFAYNPDDFTAAQFEDANGTYEVHVDSRQFPRFLTDSAQQIVWSARYSVSGLATVDNNPDGDGNTIAFAQRFPGQYHDDESGFYYNYARYYDPQIGRYVTADPIGDGHNWYVYANNNSLTYVDPFGLAACGLLDRLKSLGLAGAAGGYATLSGLAELPLAGLDLGINALGYDSDLAGYVKRNSTDILEKAGAVHLNRAYGYPDNHRMGGKLFGYGMDAVKIAQGVRGAGVIQKLWNKRGNWLKNPFRGRYGSGNGGKGLTFAQMRGYAKNTRYKLATKLKWTGKRVSEASRVVLDVARASLNNGKTIWDSAGDIARNSFDAGAAAVDQLFGPDNPQTGGKSGGW